MLKPAGGPLAVGFYIQKEHEQSGDNIISFIEDDCIRSKVIIQNKRRDSVVSCQGKCILS